MIYYLQDQPHRRQSSLPPAIPDVSGLFTSGSQPRAHMCPPLLPYTYRAPLLSHRLMAIRFPIACFDPLVSLLVSACRLSQSGPATSGDRRRRDLAISGFAVKLTTRAWRKPRQLNVWSRWMRDDDIAGPGFLHPTPRKHSSSSVSSTTCPGHWSWTSSYSAQVFEAVWAYPCSQRKGKVFGH